MPARTPNSFCTAKNLGVAARYSIDPTPTPSTVRRMADAVPPAGEGGMVADAMTCAELSCTVAGVRTSGNFSVYFFFGMTVTFTGPGTSTLSTFAAGSFGWLAGCGAFVHGFIESGAYLAYAISPATIRAMTTTLFDIADEPIFFQSIVSPMARQRGRCIPPSAPPPSIHL